MAANLKEMHETAGKLAKRLLQTTAGAIGELSVAVKAKIGEAAVAKDPIVSDIIAAFDKASATNPPQTVVSVRADQALALSSLLFGAVVTKEEPTPPPQTKAK